MWLLYASLAAAIWGFDYALAERVLRAKISPLTLFLFQTLFGAFLSLVLGRYYDLRGDLERIAATRGQLGMMMLAVVSFNVANIFIFFSIKEKNATLAGLVELSYPVFTIFFTWVLFRQIHLNAGTLAGAICILVGVVTVSYFG